MGDGPCDEGILMRCKNCGVTIPVPEIPDERYWLLCTIGGCPRCATDMVTQQKARLENLEKFVSDLQHKAGQVTMEDVTRCNLPLDGRDITPLLLRMAQARLEDIRIEAEAWSRGRIREST